MDERPGNSFPAALILAAMLALPVIYVLAVGPANVAYEALPASGQTVLEVVYAPLIWLAENSQIAEDVLSAYLDLWEW